VGRVGVPRRAGEIHRRSRRFQGIAELLPRFAADHPLFGHVVEGLTPHFPEQEGDPSKCAQQLYSNPSHGDCLATDMGERQYRPSTLP